MTADELHRVLVTKYGSVAAYEKQIRCLMETQKNATIMIGVSFFLCLPTYISLSSARPKREKLSAMFI
jgi:hypothetical protein